MGRLELGLLLQELRNRADDVLAIQGRLCGLLRVNAAVTAELSLTVVLRWVAEAARHLLNARCAAIRVIVGDGASVLAPGSERPLSSVAQQALTAADADFATLVLLHGDTEVIIAAGAGALAGKLKVRITPLSDALSGRPCAPVSHPGI